MGILPRKREIGSGKEVLFFLLGETFRPDVPIRDSDGIFGHPEHLQPLGHRHRRERDHGDISDISGVRSSKLDRFATTSRWT